MPHKGKLADEEKLRVVEGYLSGEIGYTAAYKPTGIDLTVSSNDMSGPYIHDKIAQLEGERRALERELETLDKDRHETLRKEIADIETVWDFLDINKKNAIASLLIRRIRLKEEEIEIEWKYDFDL
jgi:hypothetical protein